MEIDRKKSYLEKLFAGRLSNKVQQTLPLIDRWKKVLDSIPSLAKRSPWRHSQVTDWNNGIVTVDADQPAWLQLLIWEQDTLVALLKKLVPELKIDGIKFRLNPTGKPLEQGAFIEPKVDKLPLTDEEEKAKAEVIAELEAMIRKPEK